MSFPIENVFRIRTVDPIFARYFFAVGYKNFSTKRDQLKFNGVHWKILFSITSEYFKGSHLTPPCFSEHTKMVWKCLFFFYVFKYYLFSNMFTRKLVFLSITIWKVKIVWEILLIFFIVDMKKNISQIEKFYFLKIIIIL